MATPLSKVVEILNLLKSNSEQFANENIPEKFCLLGLIQAGIALYKEYSTYEEVVGSETIKYIENITPSETYLTALYAYRTYALQKHDEFASKAVGVKTISFAVTGLIDRARQTMKVIDWCDVEIAKTLSSLTSPYGFSNEMKEDV